MAKQSFGDPYRIKKPNKNVQAKHAFAYASFSQIRVGTLKLIITDEYLWLSTGVSIPLSSITDITYTEKQKNIVITYYHAIKDEDFAVGIFVPGLFGASVKKNIELADLIIASVEKAKPLEDIIATVDSKTSFKIACEISGNTEAKYVTLGTFFCVGIYPLAGAFSWSPKERYLSRKHAIRECTKDNVITGLIGYWGIPGIVLAPVKMWENIKSVKSAYQLSNAQCFKMFAIANIAPAAFLTSIVIAVTNAP